MPIKNGSLVDYPDIGGAFDNANQSTIPGLIGANLADSLFGQGTAHLAMADFVQGFNQRLSQYFCAVSIPLQQVERHTLGGFWTYARQTA